MHLERSVRYESVAKGGLNELDRVGAASSEHFVIMVITEMKTYVQLELFHNGFFYHGSSDSNAGHHRHPYWWIP